MHSQKHASSLHDCTPSCLLASKVEHELVYVCSICSCSWVRSQACTTAGKRDTWNGMMGGAAAGLAFGARLGKPQVGVGAAFAMAGESWPDCRCKMDRQARMAGQNELCHI